MAVCPFYQRGNCKFGSEIPCCAQIKSDIWGGWANHEIQITAEMNIQEPHKTPMHLEGQTTIDSTRLVKVIAIDQGNNLAAPLEEVSEIYIFNSFRRLQYHLLCFFLRCFYSIGIGAYHLSGRNQNSPKFHLNKDDIKLDLTDQRPIYPLSCYGPGRDAPRQLIEGPIEISPEELRCRFYTARGAGNEGAAVCVVN